MLFLVTLSTNVQFFTVASSLSAVRAKLRTNVPMKVWDISTPPRGISSEGSFMAVINNAYVVVVAESAWAQ